MLTADQVQEIKTILSEVKKILDGRKLEEISEDERKKIKYLLDSSWSYYQLLEPIFGYRGPKSHNPIQYYSLTAFTKLQDETHLSNVAWERINELVLSENIGSVNTSLLLSTVTKAMGFCYCTYRKQMEQIELEEVTDIREESEPDEDQVREAVEKITRKVKVTEKKREIFNFIKEFLIKYACNKLEVEKGKRERKFPYKQMIDLMVDEFGGNRSTHEYWWFSVLSPKLQQSSGRKPNTSWNKNQKLYKKQFIDKNRYKENMDCEKKYQQFLNHTVKHEIKTRKGTTRTFWGSPVVTYKLNSK